ncbi:flagellar hook-length control protein FliK [Undibacterium sp. CY22W]|uniref:Flagellar hook-length control protein FliK n=2 Tax=Undibacterium curvum TaxID=2762294 RepID=A0ABR7A758_9BURK|nr:flagellar hook-length control protein FliK [Undibacterium curvum]
MPAAEVPGTEALTPATAQTMREPGKLIADPGQPDNSGSLASVSALIPATTPTMREPGKLIADPGQPENNRSLASVSGLIPATTPTMREPGKLIADPGQPDKSDSLTPISALTPATAQAMREPGKLIADPGNPDAGINSALAFPGQALRTDISDTAKQNQVLTAAALAAAGQASQRPDNVTEKGLDEPLRTMKKTIPGDANSLSDLKQNKVDDKSIALQAGAAGQKTEERLSFANTLRSISQEQNTTTIPATVTQASPGFASYVQTEQAVRPVQIPVGVHQSGWDKAIGEHVISMAASKLQQAELSLNPPELGPLKIILSLNQDQANATFITAQPEVRQALEASMPKLRDMMNDAGMQLAGFNVQTQSSPSSQGQGQQQANTGFQPENSPRRNSEIVRNDAETTRSTTTAGRARTNPGAVDTFA